MEKFGHRDFLDLLCKVKCCATVVSKSWNGVLILEGALPLFELYELSKSCSANSWLVNAPTWG